MLVRPLIIACALLLLTSAGADSQTLAKDFSKENLILLQFKKDSSAAVEERRGFLARHNLTLLKHLPLNDIYVVGIESGSSQSEVLSALRGAAEVLHAEPNIRRRISAVVPNDPLFSSQWAHENIESSRGWEVQKGSREILIAIPDTGIDYTHEDLAANLWRNLDEDWGGGRPGNNGVDDDGDGYVDNYYGINPFAGTGDPLDDRGHGTQVAGIAGALGNNSKGVCGVTWNVSIMALKFLGPDGEGFLADALEALEFAVANGAQVVNMSYSAPDFSKIERDALAAAANVLFVATAGNERVNNDMLPSYPGGYDLPNLISVAASERSDLLSSFSNYGKMTVDLAAPGVSILTSSPGNDYGTASGTSMAAPHVSGLGALILAQFPGLSPERIRDRVLRTVDVFPGLQEKLLTGGRMNVYKALTAAVTGPHVFGLFPAKGPVGTQITIRGSGFTTLEGAVFFEGDLKAAVTSWRNDRIVCVVPKGAVSGTVEVRTLEGTSNGVLFEIVDYPILTGLTFPHIQITARERAFLILVNPLNQDVSVFARAVAGGGESTSKLIALGPYQKVLMDLSRFGLLDQGFFLTLQSEEFFGATVMMVNEGGVNVKALPHLYGVPYTGFEERPGGK